MNAPGHNTEDCLALRHKVQDLTESRAIAVSPPVSPNVGTNPLPVDGAGPSGPAVDIIFTDFRNPSQLIGPPSTRVWFRLEGSYIPMVAPVNYSPSRRLIIGYPASTDP